MFLKTDLNFFAVDKLILLICPKTRGNLTLTLY